MLCFLAPSACCQRAGVSSGEEKLLAALMACAASFEKSKLKSKLKSFAISVVLYLTAVRLCFCVSGVSSSSSGVIKLELNFRII